MLMSCMNQIKNHDNCVFVYVRQYDKKYVLYLSQILIYEIRLMCAFSATFCLFCEEC